MYYYYYCCYWNWNNYYHKMLYAWTTILYYHKILLWIKGEKAVFVKTFRWSVHLFQPSSHSTSFQALHDAAKSIKEEFSHVIIESSGGITEDTLQEYMGPHVDVISLSRVTQGYGVLDFSFKIQKQGHDPSNPLVKEA